MRYIKSTHAFESYKTEEKKRLFKLFKAKKRIVTQQEVATHFKNPYKKQPFRYKTAILASILMITVILWLDLIIYLPYFKVDNINYEGLEIIRNDEIAQVVNQKLSGYNLWFLPKDNYFLLSTSGLIQSLNKTFSLEAVTIEKNFPNTLIIKIKEKLSAVIYDDGVEYKILSKSGEVVKDLGPVNQDEFQNTTENDNINNLTQNNTTTTLSSSTFIKNPILQSTSTSSQNNKKHTPRYQQLSKDYPGYPIFYDKRKQAGDNNPTKLTEDYMLNVIDFYTRLKDNRIANIKYLEMEHPLAGVTVYLSKPWQIMFQPSNDIETQIKNLEIILGKNQPQKYIDLRYKDKVYWK